MKISRTKLKNKIYRETYELLSHKYSDESWEGVFELVESIKNILGSDWEFVFEKAFYDKNDRGDECRKNYSFSIIDKDTNETSLTGLISCFPAGTVEFPFEKYDMTIIVNLI